MVSSDSPAGAGGAAGTGGAQSAGPRRWVRNAQAVAREVAGETIVMVPMSRHLNALNPTASVIWQALAEPKAVDELVARVREVFKVEDPAAVRRDVEALLADLAAKSLVLPVE